MGAPYQPGSHGGRGSDANGFNYYMYVNSASTYDMIVHYRVHAAVAVRVCSIVLYWHSTAAAAVLAGPSLNN